MQLFFNMKINQTYTSIYSNLTHTILRITGNIIRAKVKDHSGKEIIYETNIKDFTKWKTTNN